MLQRPFHVLRVHGVGLEFLGFVRQELCSAASARWFALAAVSASGVAGRRYVALCAAGCACAVVLERTDGALAVVDSATARHPGLRTRTLHLPCYKMISCAQCGALLCGFAYQKCDAGSLPDWSLRCQPRPSTIWVRRVVVVAKGIHMLTLGPLRRALFHHVCSQHSTVPSRWRPTYPRRSAGRHGVRTTAAGVRRADIPGSAPSSACVPGSSSSPADIQQRVRSKRGRDTPCSHRASVQQQQCVLKRQVLA